MPEPRMNEVAQELLSQSKDQKVDWEKAGKAASYRVFFPDIALTISRLGTLDETHFELDLIGESGTAIDSLHTAPEDTMQPVLTEIFYLAEQHVRDNGINKALGYLKQT